MGDLILICNDESGRPWHIDEVDKLVPRSYFCINCQSEMEVGSKARKSWHFRHKVASLCKGAYNSELHSLAVRILCDGSEMNIPRNRKVTYSNPKIEQKVGANFRSDAVVSLGDSDVHYEVVVSNDLTEDKILYYQSSKTNCIKIDMSFEKYKSARFDHIKEMVLEYEGNKTLIYWQYDSLVPGSSNIELLDEENGFLSRLMEQLFNLPKKAAVFLIMLLFGVTVWVLFGNGGRRRH